MHRQVKMAFPGKKVRVKGVAGSLARYLLVAGILLLFMSLPAASMAMSSRPPAPPIQTPDTTSDRKQMPNAVRDRTQLPYTINNKRYFPIPSAKGFVEQGTASWYGDYFHGRRTSNGETYNMYDMTAAHKTLPMNTVLLVRNLENGRETIVRVNDRGPFVRGRVIDLSYTAARRLGVVRNGTAKVEIVALAEAQYHRGQGAPTLMYQDPTQGEFYVQIAAFAEKVNARRLKKRFTDAGHATEIQRYDQEGEPSIYRVQVYVGRKLANAKRAEKALLKRGYIGAFIIAR